ncbi:hypothetical protein NKR23_g8589 [Pleurostoma richardsiae]|uniref:Uncharacterized protein n=1 Tax=Pleurostoma richardsiae TaxID=41990 RepID=A0AA38R7N4_9PEZI|nr:hypothetical protein NKR23_g8589 [Pleurostoma richardsiae]
MSGFEIAGLVLGAFPIALSALEIYDEISRRFGFWYEIRSEYQKCQRDLEIHQEFYKFHLTQLLLPLVADDELASRLIEDPGAEGWKAPAVADALEMRLQNRYTLYLGIMCEMKRVMVELNKELAVDAEGFQEKMSKTVCNFSLDNTNHISQYRR